MPRTGRRRGRRFDVAGVEGSFVVRIDVRVTNLSLAGMAIETRNTLIVGRRYAFSIRQDRSQVEVVGRVMWCVLGKTAREGEEVAPTFRAGVQFEDVLSAQTLELQKLIEGSAVFDLGTQVFGRFVASFGGGVGIDEQAPFEVKRISLSGMLVDTDWAPQRHEVIPFETQLGDFRFAGHGRAAFIEAYDDDGGARRFRLGLEFTLLSEWARARLEEYIASLIGRDAEEASA